MTKYWLVSFVLLCTACASVPKKLELPENTQTVEFSSAKSPTAAIIGQKARWGGVIAAIKNNADNTMLEVVNFPLNYKLRPNKSDETQGRFRVYFKGLLDPVIYKVGRSITALGTVAELESGEIGEHKYDFPVLKDASVHLWKNIQRVDINLRQSPYYYHNDPYYWSGSHLNYNRPIVIRSSSSNNKPSNKSIMPPVKKR
ncbi:Slp family lipoprotein [Colwellia sp. UCD-KL20]|uniref:Slp family lipoprotein n=1 Tax=Colwellia sp. UCD-KL20 TaxID=1917165 RepID=UPI00097142AE|nr:Slp family lipoprotein [Colwellia sp. UCD-KL20]